MTGTAGKGAVAVRRVLVALHVVSSVGWMGLAVALLTLLAAIAGGVGPDAAGFARAAAHLDGTALAFLANASAFTGLVLATTTPWGLLRYWWVSVKFVLTFVQLYLGIFLLHGVLDGLSSAPGPVLARDMAIVSGLMAGALATQVWMSVAKPWGRTPLGRGRGAPGPVWLVALGVAAPAVDTAGGLLAGHPLPVVSLAVLAVIAGGRLSAARAGRAAA
jgi:hypothetical protein